MAIGVFVAFVFVGLFRVVGRLERLVRPSENIWFREESRKTKKQIIMTFAVTHVLSMSMITPATHI